MSGSSPLERSITILQAHAANPAFDPDKTEHAECVDVIRHTCRSLGLAANYRGLAWTLGSRSLLTPISDRIVLRCEALAEAFLPKHDMKTEFWPWLGCNVLAGVLSAGLASPARLLSWMPLTLVQADLRPVGASLRPTGLGHLSTLLANRGRLVYTVSRILLLSVLHVALWRGTYFFCKEFAVDFLKAQCSRAPAESIICRSVQGILSRRVGKAAGVLFATLLAYPLELLQTRLVIANTNLLATDNARTGVRKSVKQVVREHGVRGLWRGFGARILLLSLNVAARKMVEASY
jgi:hypothetical protein